jgi:RNA polymerase sigma-70 factor (ECF subfamily)
VSNDAARDRAWLETLFSSHHRQVLAYARRRVPPDEADDVLAEVFATAWQHRERVPSQALPWLYRTASHHVLHLQRSHGRRNHLAGRLAAQPPGREPDHAESVARELDARAMVTAALSRLSPRDAEVLRLAAWEELTTEELAYVLGCTVPAARVRLHRARRRLAQVLADPPPGPANTLLKEATA